MARIRVEGQRISGRSGIVKSRLNHALDGLVVLISLFAIAVCLLPMLNVLATSLSSERAIVNRWVFFWPVDIDLEAYRSVLRDASMRRSLGLTVVLTLVSTSLSMVLTILCAYPLIHKKMVGRRFFNTLIILTMYFNAGMIPDYINIQSLGLLDTFWVMVFPVGISVFNMIILKSFFQSIPDSLLESADIDGASHWVILFRIVLPLSTAALATVALFYAVNRWNGFADARIYLQSPSLYPIQFKLYQVIQARSAMDASLEGVAVKVPAEGLKSAAIMFATVPVLAVYPFLQRYFVAGVTVGAVKG